MKCLFTFVIHFLSILLPHLLDKILKEGNFKKEVIKNIIKKHDDFQIDD